VADGDPGVVAAVHDQGGFAVRGAVVPGRAEALARPTRPGGTPGDENDAPRARTHLVAAVVPVQRVGIGAPAFERRMVDEAMAETVRVVLARHERG
jgi:hypothetical protein